MKETLRIGLIMSGGNIWLGGVEYIKNIVFALASLPSEVRSTYEVCLICSSQLEDVYKQISSHLNNIYYLEKSLEPKTLPNLIRWKIARTLFDRYDPRFDSLIKKSRMDFIYPYAVKDAGGKSYRSAAWIPDCQHKHLPQFFSEEHIQGRDKEFTAVAKYAPVIVFSSKSAEADFNKYFFRTTYKSKILSFTVYPLPEWYSVDSLETQQAYHLPDRFFLVNNQFWQHKNHIAIFEALHILQKQEVYPIVVCTGSLYDYRNPSFSDTILQNVNKLGIAHQVYLLGVTTRLDMISLMRRAIAVINPSLFEGWSTVVEEARCLGKPIILSDIPVHIEQDPPYSVYFKKDSAENLAIVLADAWKNMTPGPNIELETIARNNNLKEIQAFGYRFLEIAKG